jgi:nitrate reductase NapA
MNITRREFLKTSAAATTAATVGIPIGETAWAGVKEAEADWHHGCYKGRTHRRHQG